MAKAIKALIISIIFLFILTMIIPNKIYAKSIEVNSSIKVATGVIDPDDFEPQDPTQSDINVMMNMSNVIIGTIQVIGVVVSFISLMVLGLMYMTESISEKAAYKITMIPYLIGTIMFFAITQLVALIASIVEGF